MSFILSSLWMTNPTNSAYSTPTAAASVGVNTPPMMPPRMTTGASSAHMPSRVFCASSLRLNRLGAPTPCLRQMKNEMIMAKTLNTNPGTMPPMNSLPIEAPVMTP